MKYISVEEFQEQPKEVQKILLDWWKPSTADLVLIAEFPHIEQEPLIYALKDDEDYTKTETTKDIPLLTEGQLREFIEDKSGQIVEIDLNCGGYSIVTENRECECEDLGFDLLEAYWQVACQIAKEVKNE